MKITVKLRYFLICEHQKYFWNGVVLPGIQCMPFRQEKTRLQAAVVMSVLFCGLLLSPELSCSQFSEFDSNKKINRGKTL